MAEKRNASAVVRAADGLEVGIEAAADIAENTFRCRR